jgi:hypothetical protein
MRKINAKTFILSKLYILIILYIYLTQQLSSPLSLFFPQNQQNSNTKQKYNSWYFSHYVGRGRSETSSDRIRSTMRIDSASHGRINSHICKWVFGLNRSISIAFLSEVLWQKEPSFAMPDGLCGRSAKLLQLVYENASRSEPTDRRHGNSERESKSTSSVAKEPPTNE